MGNDYRPPPICVGFEVFDKAETVVSGGFNTDSYEAAALALERAAKAIRDYATAKCGVPAATLGAD